MRAALAAFGFVLFILGFGVLLTVAYHAVFIGPVNLGHVLAAMIGGCVVRCGAAVWTSMTLKTGGTSAVDD